MIIKIKLLIQRYVSQKHPNQWGWGPTNSHQTDLYEDYATNFECKQNNRTIYRYLIFLEVCKELLSPTNLAVYS